MTRWCRPGKITQRSGAAAVHILIEHLYKFKDFGVKKLILEFSDKS